MKKLFILLTLSILSIATVHAKTKKIKIKEDKTVSYHYDTDSTCLNRKETVSLVRGLHTFYSSVHNDNYQGYLDCLSPVTHEKILPEKLKRKYKKFRGYGVHALGKMSVRYIKISPLKTEEPNTLYTCVIKLPEGQSIARRVGFDPLKHDQFNGFENHIALFLTATPSGYKVVIPW